MKQNLYILFILFSLQLDAQSVGGNTTGSVAFCDTLNSGFISLNGHIGIIQHWLYSTNSGLNWIIISNPTSTQSYSNLNQTTLYRAVVKNGSFTPDTSSSSLITIHPTAKGGNITGGGAFCQSAPSGILNLNGQVGQVVNWESSINLGNTWGIITSTLSSLPYSAITQNVMYRAIIKNVATCPTDTSTIASFVVSQNSLAGNLSKSDTVCMGANYDTLKLSGETGSVLSWIKSIDSGASWINITNYTNYLVYSNITQKTDYAVIIKNGVCPADTTSIVNIVPVNPNPVDAGADKNINQYESVQLDGSGNGFPEWSPNIQLSNFTSFTPLANPLNTITYTLKLTDEHACISLDSVIVNVVILIPTIITPNGDGVNDFFVIDKVDDYTESTLTIFNRWGTVVYSKSSYKNDWNGKSKNGNDLPDEIYYYLLDFGNGEKPISNYILIKR